MRLKSFVLIEQGQKYLLIQEANEKWKGKWYLPGGGINDGETAEQGAIREVIEESGFLVKLNQVFFVKYHKGFFNNKVSVYYTGEIIGGTVKTLADDDSLDVKWMSFEELKQVPLRKNLEELINIYREHTNFIAVEDFKLKQND